MAGEEENDFDTDMGGGSGAEDERRVRSEGDEDDDLEDLSRDELYEKYRAKNAEAAKYRTRLKRLRNREGGSSRETGRRESRKDDDERDSRERERPRNRDDERDSRRDDRSRDRDNNRSDDDSSEVRAIRAEAKVALAAAGISAERLKRAVRLIDIRNLELDGDDLLGIEDEIDDLKEEWPELFERKRSRDDEDDEREKPRRRIPRADMRSGDGRRDRKEKTASERQAEMLAAFANK